MCGAAVPDSAVDAALGISRPSNMPRLLTKGYIRFHTEYGVASINLLP